MLVNVAKSHRSPEGTALNEELKSQASISVYSLTTQLDIRIEKCFSRLIEYFIYICGLNSITLA